MYVGNVLVEVISEDQNALRIFLLDKNELYLLVYKFCLESLHHVAIKYLLKSG